jgi:hypothetical protein
MRTIEGQLLCHSIDCHSLRREDSAGFIHHLPCGVTYEGTIALTKPTRFRKYPVGLVNIRGKTDDEEYVFKRALITDIEFVHRQIKGRVEVVATKVAFNGPAI